MLIIAIYIYEWNVYYQHFNLSCLKVIFRALNEAGSQSVFPCGLSYRPIAHLLHSYRLLELQQQGIRYPWSIYVSQVRQWHVNTRWIRLLENVGDSGSRVSVCPFVWPHKYMCIRSIEACPTTIDAYLEPNIISMV